MKIGSHQHQGCLMFFGVFFKETKSQIFLNFLYKNVMDTNISYHHEALNIE